MTGASQLLIRELRAGDLPAVQLLLKQLGYDLDAGEVERRLATIAARAEHTVLVAELNGRVCGLMHIYPRPALDKPPEVIVQALVVEAGLRGAGVGRSLMAAAESWAAKRGFPLVALTSNVARDGAHAFYRTLGYELAATSHLFRKQL